MRKRLETGRETVRQVEREGVREREGERVRRRRNIEEQR